MQNDSVYIGLRNNFTDKYSKYVKSFYLTRTQAFLMYNDKEIKNGKNLENLMDHLYEQKQKGNSVETDF
jgi:hypothetical protein